MLILESANNDCPACPRVILLNTTDPSQGQAMALRYFTSAHPGTEFFSAVADYPDCLPPSYSIHSNEFLGVTHEYVIRDEPALILS